MNIVLFLLIIMASMFVASSTNQMYSTSVAIQSFIDQSRVADLNALMANTNEENKRVEAWSKSEKTIMNTYSQLQIGVLSKDITVPKTRKNFSGNAGLVLSTVPKDVNLVFGEDDQQFELKQGELALPISLMNATELQAGDLLNVNLGGTNKTFIVTHFFKDAYMGSDLLSFKRMLISEQDFTELQEVIPDKLMSKLWSFNTAPGSHGELTSAFSKQNFTFTIVIEKELVAMSYLTDRILSAILFVISLFLIFIAFLTLHFTIVSTLQNDYKEIGVLKAIGFRDFAIKRLYLTKYLGLSIIGGVVGFIIGIQLSALMSHKLSQYIIKPDSTMGILVSMISVMAMIVVTLLFCLLCMQKISKASAIDAIRQGHTGERFKASRKIHLHHSKYLSPALFLAFSDVINKLKSYSVLIVTFILSVAIIITPINLMNTIVTPKFINYLGVIEADFYTKSEVANKPVTEIRKELSKLDQKILNKNSKITLTVDYSFNAKYISDNGKDNMRISGMKSEPATTFQYLEGEAPKLTNEIAITSIMSQKYDKHIGDYITFEIDNKKDRFLITGLIQTITNEGNMIRVGDAYSPVNATSYLFAGKINVPELEKEQVLEALQQQLPELDLKSATDLLGEITGGFMGQLKSIIYLLTASVCLITFFITSLFVRLLIAKEVQSIAVMKSLGFKNGVIQRWQVLRISILLLGSIIIGVFTANVLGEWVIGFVFQMFGVTKMSFNIVPQQVYLLFPFLILLVVLLSVYSSCGQIKKVQVWEMKQE